MAGVKFDINTDEHIKLTRVLGELHRSALPVAVRSTLNDAAFEAKRRIPETAARKMITRKKSFFRVFSLVNKASGFDMSSMAAEVGINPAKGSRVADGLAAQEKGGTVQGRKLIPHDMGRVSKSHRKPMSRRHRLSGIRISKPGRKSSGSKYLLIKKGGKGTVFEIRKAGKRTKLTPVYHYRNTRVSRVKPTNFMKSASLLASKRIPASYLKNARRQIKRLTK